MSGNSLLSLGFTSLSLCKLSLPHCTEAFWPYRIFGEYEADSETRRLTMALQQVVTLWDMMQGREPSTPLWQWRDDWWDPTQLHLEL